MFRLFRLLSVGFLMLAFYGCAHRIGDFTVASTKNINLKTATYTVNYNQRLIGEDRVHYILFIPTGVPNMKEAMDNAIEKSPGAVGLSDVVVKYCYFNYIFYGAEWYSIEGNPIYENRPVSQTQNQPVIRSNIATDPEVF